MVPEPVGLELASGSNGDTYTADTDGEEVDVAADATEHMAWCTSWRRSAPEDFMSCPSLYLLRSACLPVFRL